MARNLQRLSQLVTTFGPGAMIDLPTRSVLVGGLERWDMREGSFKSIDEPRLARMIERQLKRAGRLDPAISLTLRTPPLAKDPGQGEPQGVVASIFPTWFVCDSAGDGGRRRRRLVQWTDLSHNQRGSRFVDDAGKKLDVTPIRFVAACEKGHLQDINWRWIVHGDGECSEPMWVEEQGTSADPRDTRVVCDCGKSLSLEQTFQKGRLGRCRGERPWLGDRDPAGCDHMLKLLIRTATNTYFPQVATVISLPSAEDQLTRLVHHHFGMLQSVPDAATVNVLRQHVEALKASFEGYDSNDIFARVELLRHQTEQNASLSPKLAEFEVFASGRETMGSNEPGSLLHAETLARPAWDPASLPHCHGIQALVAVHRLREVSCLYGFTRFEAAPTAADSELEDVWLAVDGAPLSRGADWLPAVEQFGEGLFIHVDPDAVTAWSERDAAIARGSALQAGYDRWKSRRGDAASPYPGLAYIMLHSLSHALMSEIALDCGYPASSLKERIYALANPLQPSRFDRCGILIYTASSGAQGTLGGLIATAGRFGDILRSALDRIALCSNDPVCSDHVPASSDDDRALHGAACHGCLLIAETSCESRNLFLDRGLLVRSMDGEAAPFFDAE